MVKYVKRPGFGREEDDKSVVQSSGDSSAGFSGGDGRDSGFNIRAFGAGHTTRGGDGEFRYDTELLLDWDESDDEWTFHKTVSLIGGFSWSGSSDGDFLVGDGTGSLVLESGATARASMGVTIGSDVQAWDADLDTYSANPLTAAELGELQNIDTVTITNTQWGYLGSLDQSLVTSDSPTFANLTLTGNLTSLGIDDNATGERLEINDTSLDVGTSGSLYTIRHSAEDQVFRLQGGNTGSSAGAIWLYGGSHSTAAGDIALMGGSSTTILQWDQSQDRFEFKKDIIAEADLTVEGAFTSLGIDDNATAEVLELADTTMDLGQSGSSFNIRRDVNDQSLTITAGNTTAVGFNYSMYGGAHASTANDFRWRSDTTEIFRWDNSDDQFEFKKKVIVEAYDFGVDTDTLYVDSTNDRIGLGIAAPTVQLHTYEGTGLGSNDADEIHIARFEALVSGSTERALNLKLVRNAAEGATTWWDTSIRLEGIVDTSTNAQQWIEFRSAQASTDNAIAFGEGDGDGSTWGMWKDGSLGVGITPEDLLHVHGSGTGKILVTDDTNNAVLSLKHTGATPAADTELGRINFSGFDDAGATQRYASIMGFVTDDTAGSEDGYMTFSTVRAGTVTEAFRVDHEGHVGFNITGPNAPIHTAGDSAFGEALIIQDDGSASSWARMDFNNTNATGTGIIYQDQAGKFVIRNQHATADLAFFTNGANERLTIDGATGYVGILETNPTEALDVTGNIVATGAIGGLTQAELGELQNIDTTSISTAQWAWVGSMDQPVGSSTTPTFAGINLGDENLDDYDEGTFTPVVADASSGGNTATGTMYGHYQRVGNWVNIVVHCLNIDTTGMSAGNDLFIRSLPFTADSLTGTVRFTGAVTVAGNVTFSEYLIATVTDNTSYARIFEHNSGGTVAALDVSDIPSGTGDILFSMSYQVA